MSRVIIAYCMLLISYRFSVFRQPFVLVYSSSFWVLFVMIKYVFSSSCLYFVWQRSSSVNGYVLARLEIVIKSLDRYTGSLRATLATKIDFFITNYNLLTTADIYETTNHVNTEMGEIWPESIAILHLLIDLLTIFPTNRIFLTLASYLYKIKRPQSGKNVENYYLRISDSSQR